MRAASSPSHFATGGPFLMGVLNVTPDSFSDGGQFLAADRAIVRAAEMVAEGADLIDVGAESTRPYGGARPVEAREEIARLAPPPRKLSQGMSDALIGFGGNIGDARAILDRAVQLFCDDPAIRLTARSSDYLPQPWGVTDQPAFVNLCISVETSLSPRALLRRALATEARLGRDGAKRTRWGPRVVDIDIPAYDDLAIDEADFSLPRPRMLERAFVLAPLAEIAPDRTIMGEPIRRWVERVDASGITKLN